MTETEKCKFLMGIFAMKKCLQIKEENKLQQQVRWARCLCTLAILSSISTNSQGKARIETYLCR